MSKESVFPPRAHHTARDYLTVDGMVIRLLICVGETRFQFTEVDVNHGRAGIMDANSLLNQLLRRNGKA